MYARALRALLNPAEGTAAAKGVVLDRSLMSDIVFADKNLADGNISPEGYAEVRFIGLNHLCIDWAFGWLVGMLSRVGPVSCRFLRPFGGREIFDSTDAKDILYARFYSKLYYETVTTFLK
jgi:hypothetical protein